MQGAGIRIARVRRIEIRIHASSVVVLAVILLSIGAGGLKDTYPGWPVILPWIVGVAVAVLYAASIAAHELAHAIAARHRGIPVESISLHAFGGTTAGFAPARTPGDEAFIAAAGPLASVALAIAFTTVAVLVPVSAPTGPAGEAVAAIAVFVAVLNLVVGLVNFVPTYPMDGGRLLRAMVWRRTGSERRGTRASAGVGRWLGFALVSAGLVLLFTGDRLDGALLLLCGWTLRSGGISAARTADVEELLDGVSVGDVMELDIATIAPHVTLDVVAGQLLVGGDRMAIAVRDDGRFVGLLGISQVRGLRRATGTVTRVADRMTRLASLPVLAADDPIWHGVEELHRTGLDGLPVMRETDLLGLLTRSSVSRAVRSRVAARLAGAR